MTAHLAHLARPAHLAGHRGTTAHLPRRCVRLALLILSAGALWVTVPTAQAKVVWLCQPSQTSDPCRAGLSTTYVSPTLKPYRTTYPHGTQPPVDCFYVYPTISSQKTTYSNLQIQPGEVSVAHLQVARFSQYCRVYAPMYHQLTIQTVLAGNPEGPAQLKQPLADVRAAFEAYLRQDNHGRGFVLIGHSQGSRVLRLLIQQVIDPDPALRRLMLSAILPGDNILVKRGSDVGGDFTHVPACRTARSLHCVIAYSSFNTTPPTTSRFGRSTNPADQVLCVNPAALIGARTPTPIFPTTGFGLGTLTAPLPATVWTTEPGAYSGRCMDVDGADVLEIHAVGAAEVPAPAPTPDWGLHLLDLNLVQGDLLTVLHDEELAYRAG